MAAYNHYGNYYDPTGSQSSQPQSYTYQQSAATTHYPSQANSNYQSNNYQSYTNAHDNQQQQQLQQQPGLSARSAPDHSNGHSPLPYDETGPVARSNKVLPLPDSSYAWNHQNNSSFPQTTFPERNQPDAASTYAGTSSSSATFGRLSVPEPSQSSSATFNNSQAYPSGSMNSQTYRNASGADSSKLVHQPAYNQTQSHTQPNAHSQGPQRYASPIHAVQARQLQDAHVRQGSDSSAHQPPVQLPAQTHAQVSAQHVRQQSGSVEPSPTTVNPSQVYDNRAERQRQLQMETARRRKVEDARIAREAEEAAQKAEQQRLDAEKRSADEASKKAQAAVKKKAAQELKNEQRRNAREEKRQSKTAATALQQLASGGGSSTGSIPVADDLAPPLTHEEAEMRAMFKKMREFNSRNPAMLAKLWEEERNAHTAAPSPSQQLNTAPVPTPQQQQQQAAPVMATSSRTSAKKPAVQVTKVAPASAVQLAGKAAPPVTLASPTPVLWPPHKKASLADAAAKWLQALPGNRGKTVSIEEIMKFLDRNPSYVQLCESIESMGVRFERSSLARELLKAVPDGMKAPIPSDAQQEGGTPLANTPRKRGRTNDNSSSGKPFDDTATVNYQTPSFTPLVHTVPQSNDKTAAMAPNMAGSSIPPIGTGDLVKSSANAGTRPPSHSNGPAATPETKEEAPRLPADKEEAARKRTFGDLVDLTTGDSDDESPPRKMLQVTYRPVDSVLPQRQQYEGLNRPMSYQEFIAQNTKVTRPEPSLPLYRPTMPMTVPQDRTSGHQPIPQQETAPIPTAPPPQQVMQERAQHDRMRGKMLVEPIMRDRVARRSKYDSRTIARDVLLATGRHPDMRSLNGHLNVMQKLLSDHGGTDHGGNKSDLGTIRWDLIDSDEVNYKARAKLNNTAQAGTRLQMARGVEHGDADDESEAPPARAAGHDKRRPPDVAVVQEYANGKQSQHGTPKSRGRPRVHGANSVHASSDRIVQRSGGTPAGRFSSMATPETGVPVGYAAFRQIDEEGNIVKKKGRPVGWRKNIHSREAQGLTPAKPGQNSRTANRLRNSQTPNEKIVQAHYEVYRCEWDDCKAELHNLDTLKKHLVKVHGKSNDNVGFFECLWADCKDHSLYVDQNGRRTHHKHMEAATFETIQYWMEHVDKAHVQQVAWKLGDGPKSDHTPQDSDAYLSDNQGRSVTPVIVPSQLSPSHTHRPMHIGVSSSVLPFDVTNSRPVGRAPKGVPSKDEKAAAAELATLTEQKRLEGIVMGQEGCKLVNAKRRRGFLDDEDFEDLIESD